MDGTWIRKMKPALTRYLNRFSDCFRRKTPGELRAKKRWQPIVLAHAEPTNSWDRHLALSDLRNAFRIFKA